ncbi:MAG: glucose-1-phosphate cytidylyltransferase [Thaumarchaeota archaeon]|jgi:glucose-1-phosphate cytidylyltransferase|nr:MAG: glucose-1-phosphate cytidylyltransferase [Nitrososphaerota archaeon]
MKAVILAGGFGTRISEESHLKPKPMIEIGRMPILWHIMKNYSTFGVNEFVICLGYKGYMIKEFFANYYLHKSDVTIDLHKNEVSITKPDTEPWKVTLVETGENTMTGGRIKKAEKYIDDTFCLTYGDGVSNVNITSLIEFHKNKKEIATLTAVQPPGKFGSLLLDGDRVSEFVEKPKGDNSWINGGFFVFETEVLDKIKDDSTILEKHVLSSLAKENQINAFRHDGFWQPMDTLRDKNYLQNLWATGNAPWKLW